MPRDPQTLVTTADTRPSTDGPAVRTITMSRPEARNAMSTALLAQLLDAVADAVADDAVGVIVIAGDAGHFSGGADLKEPLDVTGEARRMELFGHVYQAVATCPKATIAALQGACVGGGAEVAVATDIRVAARDTRIRFPGAAVGYPVGPAKLVGLVGLGQAKDLVLTSKTIDAVEAHRIGIVQRLADGDPLPLAHEVAAAVASNHSHTVTYLKAQFDRFSGLGDRVAAENDALHALAEAGGDYTALTAPNPKTSSGWSATAWTHR
ncbi:enoyl-CoA hydratase/isomerase family protein [Euzebya sp.]|uniref:enoyl-CoA hydratase/isomerase family protein n=1 Tax=Euzebya sp. TaxID=1971409 RepID=UPI0035197DFB